MTSSPVDIAICMGSQSDWATMKEAAIILDELGISYEARIIAHLTDCRILPRGQLMLAFR